MTPDTSFNYGAVAPVECLKTGWATIKDQYWLFLGLTLVALLLGGAVPIVLVGPMMCGLYLCLLGRMRGEAIEFGLLFKGFDYFVPGLVAAAIQTVPVLLIVLVADGFFFGFMFAVMPHGGSRDEGPPPIFFLGITIFVLVVMIVSLIIQAIFLFAYPLIVDRKLSGWEATKASYNAVMKNFGGVVGLILLNAGLGIVGVLCCYVGVFLVMPVTFAAQAAAYRQVFPETHPIMPSPPPPPPGSWAA